jgi:hypothetical protein
MREFLDMQLFAVFRKALRSISPMVCTDVLQISVVNLQEGANYLRSPSSDHGVRSNSYRVGPKSQNSSFIHPRYSNDSPRTRSARIALECSKQTRGWLGMARANAKWPCRTVEPSQATRQCV